MSEHTAVVSWERRGAPFVGSKYSREHEWRFDGGLVVPASESPHIVPPPGSNAALVDPEEAFVASLASCHMLWFLSFAAKDGYIVERYEDAPVGTLAENAQGRVAMTHVTLRPQVTFSGIAADPVALYALHERAHAACFLAASVKTDITIEPRDGAHA